MCERETRGNEKESGTHTRARQGTKSKLHYKHLGVSSYARRLRGLRRDQWVLFSLVQTCFFFFFFKDEEISQEKGYGPIFISFLP